MLKLLDERQGFSALPITFLPPNPSPTKMENAQLEKDCIKKYIY